MRQQTRHPRKPIRRVLKTRGGRAGGEGKVKENKVGSGGGRRDISDGKNEGMERKRAQRATQRTANRG